ncbi:MAG: amino acid racemase [Bacteroidota bacterium]
MEKVGIIGGIGPESTIEYYRLIINGFRERLSTDQYPEVLIHSINMTEMLDLVFKDELDALVELLKRKINVLEVSQVDYVALASNTPHLVFDRLAKSVSVPLISIVEETCKYVLEAGVRTVGLLGTKSTMSKGFYQEVGEKYGLEIYTPNEEDQAYVHEKYMGELVFKQIIPETKSQLIQIVKKLETQKNIEGIILGGTELPLILQQGDFDTLKVFDTTRIHVHAILDKMIS